MINRQQLELYQQLESEGLSRSFDPSLLQNHVRASLANFNNQLALNYYFLNKDLLNLKIRFSYIGQLAEYLNNYYEDPWLPYRFSNFTFTFCSDHFELTERLGRLIIPDIVKETGNTENCIMFAMMSLIREDWEEVEHYLGVLRSFLQRAKHSLYTPLYISTLEAFRDRDADKLKQALTGFESKRLKAHRKKVNPIEEYISIVPLGYLKLAWLRGMEIEIDSEYLPKEWLPYQPLMEYTIPYSFLRDYYREQGINWRYDPVYPELQNWTNDPENPDKGGFSQ